MQTIKSTSVTGRATPKEGVCPPVKQRKDPLKLQGLVVTVTILLLGAANVSRTSAQSSPVPPRSVPSASPVQPAPSKQAVQDYIRQGDRAFAQGNYKEAVEAYTKSLDLYELNAYAYYNRGNAYRKLKDYKSAITDLTKALQLNPQNTFTYLYRGMALQATNQTEAAIADYTALIKIDEQQPLAYLRRAEAYATVKQRDLARADFKQAADIYKKQGDPAQSEKVLSQLRSLK